MTPFQIAFERFRINLGQEEETSLTPASLADVAVEVENLRRRYDELGGRNKPFSHLERFIAFLQRHSRAVDSMVQAKANPYALIWGILRVVLEVCFPHAFMTPG
jgi:hypothetical protein